jgi:hypothetical protein
MQMPILAKQYRLLRVLMAENVTFSEKQPLVQYPGEENEYFFYIHWSWISYSTLELPFAI